MLNSTLFTFRIYAKKTLRICVKAKSQDRISYIFIDSPIITFSPSSHFKKNSSVICSSTFQLVIQIFTKTSENYIGSNENLNYETQNADFKTIKINHMNEHLKFNLPSALFPNTTKSSVLQFRTATQIRVNVTLFSVKYEGIETSDCRYGGISIFDNNTQILDICRNYGTHTSLRSVYSTYSMLAIVIYRYFPHSNISTNFLVSATKCKPIRINPCYLHHKIPIILNHIWCKHRMETIDQQLSIRIEINHNKDEILVKSSSQEGKCGILQLSTDYIRTSCPLFLSRNEYYVRLI